MLVALTLLLTSPTAHDEARSVRARCPAVAGDDEARRANARERREQRIEVSAGPHSLTLVHSDQHLEEPTPGRLKGLDVTHIVKERRSERRTRYAALVRLSDRLTERCGTDVIKLRVDDALGVDGRIAAITPQGVLADVPEGLVWVPPKGRDAEDDRFLLVWRSDFRIYTPAEESTVATKSSPAAKRAAAIKKRRAALLKKKRAAAAKRRAAAAKRRAAGKR